MPTYQEMSKFGQRIFRVCVWVCNDVDEDASECVVWWCVCLIWYEIDRKCNAVGHCLICLVTFSMDVDESAQFCIRLKSFSLSLSLFHCFFLIHPTNCTATAQLD